MFDEEQVGDENIGWPAYVDFLSTFVFVLIVFIGSLLYLLSGDIRQRIIERRIQSVIQGLKGSGVIWQRDGNRVKFPLQSKVAFETGRVDLLPQHQQYLREVARNFANPGVKRIVVLGFADSQPCQHDPFCNWDLSARRAQEVLKFFYLCANCEFSQDDIRKKLTLTGEGNIGSSAAGPRDRRVDIILEFSEAQK